VINMEMRMDATVAGRFRVRITGGVLTHTGSGKSVVVGDEGPRLVGRGESCHLRLEDRLVSTAHCELVATERGVLIRDLGSTNGTRINDVTLGPSQYALLRRPAKIRLGGSDLEFSPKVGEERELVGRFGAFETRSAKMGLVFGLLEKVVRLSSSVHITGEIGTGKGYFAEQIHKLGARANRPFQIIDCAAIPAALAEAELFGHEKGAFTGAIGAKLSPFVEADGGTVFLDEIAELPLEVQARLLRVVDAQEVKSVGQNRYRKVDVRIISATKHNLAARVNQGLFRDDLYSRLTAAHIVIPPLRERIEDIEPLISHMLSEFGNPALGEEIPPEKIAWLKRLPWTGNVRQLRHVVRNLVDLTRAGSDTDIATAVETAYELGPAERPLGGATGAASTSTSEGHASPGVFEMLTANGTDLSKVQEQAIRVVLDRLFRDTGGELGRLVELTGASRNYVSDLLDRFGLRKKRPREKGKPG
jgi:DNA-binding NtrC family response regulator